MIVFPPRPHGCETEAEWLRRVLYFGLIDEWRRVKRAAA